MYTVTVHGTTGPVLRDVLKTLAEMSSPRWAKGAPNFLQVMVHSGNIVVVSSQLWVAEELRRRYREQKDAAEGCVTRVT